MSDEQFLVSQAGRVIDPSDPLGHFDEEPSEEDKSDALPVVNFTAFLKQLSDAWQSLQHSRMCAQQQEFKMWKSRKTNSNQ